MDTSEIFVPTLIDTSRWDIRSLSDWFHIPRHARDSYYRADAQKTILQ